jgi:hypothetical protein
MRQVALERPHATQIAAAAQFLPTKFAAFEGTANRSARWDNNSQRNILLGVWVSALHDLRCP